MAICWFLGFRVATRWMATARTWRLRVHGDCAYMAIASTWRRRKAGLLVPNWLTVRENCAWMSQQLEDSLLNMHVFLHFSLIILPHPLSVSQMHVSSLVEKFYSFSHMLTFLNFFWKIFQKKPKKKLCKKMKHLLKYSIFLSKWNPFKWLFH